MRKLILTLLVVVSMPLMAAITIPADTTQAVKLIKKADKILKKGNPNAEYEAVELYKQAAEMGLTSAQQTLQEYYLSKSMIANAMKWTLKLAEQGEPKSEYTVGYGCLFGENAEGYNGYFHQDYEKAFYWIKRASSHDNADERACALLASCYENGYGTEVDLKEAVKWYGIAAEKDNAFAMVKYAMAYYEGTGIDKNPELAVKWMTKSAEKGNPDAQYNLGYFYHVGDVVKQDLDEAIYWYTKAVDQGSTAAKNNLAVCMDTKNGVSSNNETVHLYRESAESGDEFAQYNLGNCYLKGEGVSQDPLQAFYWYKKSAENGCPQGQNLLGHCYIEGIGTDVSQDKAFYWFQKSAEQSDSIGMYNLASCYFGGIGTATDSDKGFYWCKKSADVGTIAALRDLGICYRDGIGTTQNIETALDYLHKAAVKGFIPAYADIAYIYCNNKKDFNQAIKYYRLAIANEEDYNSKYNLALCYFSLSDFSNALKYYTIAAENGIPQAMYSLALMYYNGQGTRVNITETKKWMKKASEQNVDSNTKKLAKEALKILNQ